MREAGGPVHKKAIGRAKGSRHYEIRLLRISETVMREAGNPAQKKLPGMPKAAGPAQNQCIHNHFIIK